jgi:hypothetical protein
MPTPQEPDFPAGHPARFDYDPSSPEAKEWARLHVFLKGERDYPPGHPKAVDTEGNRNAEQIVAGVDPDRPDYEAFTGRTPAQAKAAREVYQAGVNVAKESPVLMPTIALDPPKELGLQRAQLLTIDGQPAAEIFCPGCKSLHVFDSRWTFNGSLELPTFTPSMLVSNGAITCHSYVTNGKIQFLNDSTHALSGQTVDLPPVAQMQETINAARP